MLIYQRTRISCGGWTIVCFCFATRISYTIANCDDVGGGWWAVGGNRNSPTGTGVFGILGCWRISDRRLSTVDVCHTETLKIVFLTHRNDFAAAPSRQGVKQTVGI